MQQQHSLSLSNQHSIATAWTNYDQKTVVTENSVVAL